MAFTFTQPVMFKHCDPAGIVFYPRYFEMINDVVELFFADIGYSFHRMHPDHGVPTAEIATTFNAPSRHGDDLLFTLAVTRVGRTSLGLGFNAVAGAETRLAATSTIVHVNATGRPEPWPDDMRAALSAHLEGDIR